MKKQESTTKSHRRMMPPQFSIVPNFTKYPSSPNFSMAHVARYGRALPLWRFHHPFLLINGYRPAVSYLPQPKHRGKKPGQINLLIQKRLQTCGA